MNSGDVYFHIVFHQLDTVSDYSVEIMFIALRSAMIMMHRKQIYMFSFL